LRNTLAENLANIEPGLTLFTEKGEIKGIEYRTEVGPRDILTRDEKTTSLFLRSNQAEQMNQL
jgi:hypothetical protein